MKRYFFQLFVLTLTVYTFRVPIANLLDWFLVRKILSKITPSVLNDMLFVTGSVLVFRFLYRRSDTKLLLNISMLSAVAYLFNRFESLWVYIPMHSFKQMSYFDLVVAAIGLPGIVKLLVSFKKITQKDHTISENENKGFDEDIAVQTIDNDSFKRSDSAKMVAKRIHATKNKRAFAIGVVGEYGSGKTSFLNLVGLHLRSIEKKTAPLTIYFNPWDCDTPQDIQRTFFSQLVEKLSEHDASLSSQIHTYSRKLRHNDNILEVAIKRIDLVNSIISNNTQSEYEKINNKIANLRQKVVIFVDDLDRLHPDEIMEVLRLIRNTANFANIFYIVGYERNYVTEAIRKINEKGHLNYLDKIFQLEIPLPKTEHSNLLIKLKSKLKNKLSEVHYNELVKGILPLYFESDYDDSVKLIFRNLRDVVKFVNSFLITYELISKEAHFKDLFFNELLKFRYPMVFDILYEKTDSFLYLLSYSYLYKEYYFLMTLEKEKETLAVTGYLKAHHSLDYTDQDHVLIDRILRVLYLEDRSHLTGIVPNAICNPASFNLYYQNRLSVYDISEHEFDAVRQQDLTSICKYIDSCFNKNKHKQLLVRLLKEDFSINRRYYEKMTHAIFYIAPKYIAAESFTSFPTGEFLPKFVDIDGIITKKVYENNKEAYKSFVATLLDNNLSPPFIFHNELILKIKEKYLKDFPLPEEKLTKIQLSYFSEMSSSGHGLSKETMWLFWGIRNKSHKLLPEGHLDTWKIDLEAINLLKLRLTDNEMTDFLQTTIEKIPFNADSYSLNKKILDEIFVSYEELRKTVEENTYTPNDIRIEYLSFLDACQKVEFARPVEFHFQTILDPKNGESTGKMKKNTDTETKTLD